MTQTLHGRLLSSVSQIPVLIVLGCAANAYADDIVIGTNTTATQVLTGETGSQTLSVQTGSILTGYGAGTPAYAPFGIDGIDVVSPGGVSAAITTVANDSANMSNLSYTGCLDVACATASVPLTGGATITVQSGATVVGAATAGSSGIYIASPGTTASPVILNSSGTIKGGDASDGGVFHTWGITYSSGDGVRISASNVHATFSGNAIVNGGNASGTTSFGGAGINVWGNGPASYSNTSSQWVWNFVPLSGISIVLNDASSVTGGSGGIVGVGTNVSANANIGGDGIFFGGSAGTVTLNGSSRVTGGIGGNPAGGASFDGMGGNGVEIMGSGNTVTLNGTSSVSGGNGGAGGSGVAGGTGGGGILLGAPAGSCCYGPTSNTTVTIGSGTTVTGGNGGAGGSGAAGGASGAAIQVFDAVNTTITNAGTLTAGTAGAAGAGGTAGSVAPALDFSQATDSVSFTNNGGTINGSIHTSDHGDTLRFNGGIINGAIQGIGGTGAMVSFIGGSTVLTNNIGEDNGLAANGVNSVTINPGAILVLSQGYNNIYINTKGGSGFVNNGTLNIGTSVLDMTYSSLSGNGKVLMTFANGYGGLIKAGGNTGINLSSMTIVPTLSNVTISTGQSIVFVKDYGGGSSVMPTVQGGGHTWAASIVAATGQTDAIGASYGSGYNDLILTATGVSATAIAVPSGPNAASVSAISSYSGTNPGLQSLATAVNDLTSTAEIQKAGAQLRPEINGGTTSAALGATTQALTTVQVHSDSMRMAAAKQTGVATGETLRGLGLWGQGFGSYATQDRRESVDGYTSNTYGLAFGADTLVLDSLRAGLSFAYARTGVDDTGTRNGSGQKINSYIGTLYGTYTATKWYVDGTLTFGWHDYASTRLVNFTGATPETDTASYAGRQYGAKTEFGYPVAVGEALVTPLFSLDFNHLYQNGYTESGGASALSISGSDTDSFRTGLGNKVSVAIGQAGSWTIQANARAMWLHEFIASSPAITSTFVAGGSAFTTSGMTVARDHADVGVGIDLATIRNTDVSLKYDADLADRYVSHTGSLQVRTEF